MPDFMPAPAFTATSAPSPIYFFTVSGVAATRVSLGSGSVGTAIRIKVSASVGKPQRQGPSGPMRSERQESENDEDDDAVDRTPFHQHEEAPIGPLVLGIIHIRMPGRENLLVGHFLLLRQWACRPVLEQGLGRGNRRRRGYIDRCRPDISGGNPV